MTDKKLPKIINGISVEAHNPESVMKMAGEHWVTMSPTDETLDGLWEFSLTTGRIMDMSRSI